MESDNFLKDLEEEEKIILKEEKKNQISEKKNDNFSDNILSLDSEENIFFSKLHTENFERPSIISDKSSYIQNLSIQDIEIMEEKLPRFPPKPRNRSAINIKKKKEENQNIKKRVSLRELDISFELPQIDENTNYFENIPFSLIEERLEKKNLKNVTPMKEINVYKLFDSLMIEKKKDDDICELNKKTKKNMNEFCLTYFYRTYTFGVKELLYKNLLGFKTTIENLYKDNDPYGILMARMLGICECKALDDQISDLILNISYIFEFIRNQWNKEEAKLHEKAEKIKNKKNDEKTKDLEAPLLDIYELTLKIFEKDQENCLEVINNLFPKAIYDNEKVTDFDSLLVLILNYKFAKMGKNLKEIFEQCDAKGNKMISYDEFNEGILNRYQIKFHPEQKKKLFCLLDHNNDGSIEVKEWNKFIHLHDYKRQYHLTTIVKIDYLILILEVLEKKMENKKIEIFEIFNKIKSENKSYISLEEFILFSEKNQKKLKKEFLLNIFIKGINYQNLRGIYEDGLRFETFFRIVTKEKFENIGEYLKFNETKIMESMQAKKIRIAKKKIIKA